MNSHLFSSSVEVTMQDHAGPEEYWSPTSPQSENHIQIQTKTVILLVDGTAGVPYFERDYPTHLDRCHLAMRLELDPNYSLRTPSVYTVQIKRFNWIINEVEFETFMEGFVAQTNRCDRWFFFVSDYCAYDYSCYQDTEPQIGEAAMQDIETEDPGQRTPPRLHRHVNPNESLQAPDSGATTSSGSTTSSSANSTPNTSPVKRPRPTASERAMRALCGGHLSL